MDEEDEQIAFDPKLEQKIDFIKNNNIAKSSEFASDTQTHNAVTAADDRTGTDSQSYEAAHSKNMSKLEEVLRRQRERLEHISGTFASHDHR